MTSRISKGAFADLGVPLAPDSGMDTVLFIEQREEMIDGVSTVLLTCMGITDDELELCKTKSVAAVVAQLQMQGYYPFTNPARTQLTK
ncbi:MAG: hypothetical protein RLZZ436_4638 [Planctomycetota bacterium]|jgi:hypothetical protein